MKLIPITLLALLMSVVCRAQQEQYQAFIYTSDDLANEIAKLNDNVDQSRSYMGNLFGAGGESIKGLASGYVTSFIDLGVNAIGSLFTRNTRLKEEWEKTVKTENEYKKEISTLAEVNNFYESTSFDGAMDPKGMRFDGIGCLRKEGNDTLFYVSCHIDRSKLQRIINHSKFELVLDTLIISPTHSNLPNTRLNLPFSFDERKNFTLTMSVKLLSSWINEAIQLNKDQELGSFTINIPVDKTALDENGFLRYARSKDDPAGRYKVNGESFIVPRSYMGFRDRDNNYRSVWGTGEYKLQIELKETCDVTDAYRQNWKADTKKRKRMTAKKDFIETSWKTISSQKWDELARAWVITTLKAPASMVTEDLINKLGLSTNAASAQSLSGAAAVATGSKTPTTATQQGGQSTSTQGQGSGMPNAKPQ